MTEPNSSGPTIKVPRKLEEINETDSDESRLTKAKRYDIEVPSYEVDIKLAEKLDHLLSIGDVRKPRFFLHKPNQQKSDITKKASPLEDIDKSKLVPKNLDKEELRERLVKKYDTLVPELDPKRNNVKLIKVLSAKESVELARAEAKKQLEHQLVLNSVSGNSRAYTKGTSSFRFNDGYELPTKCFLPGKKTPLMLRKPKLISSSGAGKEVKPTNSGKSVKFSDNNEIYNVSKHGAYAHNYDESDEEDDDVDDDEDEDAEEDDLTEDDESDCSTVTASSENEKIDDAEKPVKD